MRRSLLIGLVALAVFIAGSLDLRFGDLRYGIGGKTLRHWNVADVSMAWKPACAFVRSGGFPCGGSSSYILSGPSTGNINGSLTYTVQPIGSLSSPVVVTPNDASHNGIFSPTTVTLTGAGSQTFTYIPLKTGSYNISTTNGGGLTNPSPIAFSSANIAPGYPGMAGGTWVTNHDATFANALAGDPFGGSLASRITEGVAIDYHSIISNTFTTVSGQAYTVSLMIKTGSGSRLLDVELDDIVAFSAAMGMSVDPVGCSIVGTYVWGGAVVNSTAVRTSGLGAGWCLVQMTGSLGAFTSAAIQLFPDNGGNNLYAGDGTSNELVYGPVVQ